MADSADHPHGLDDRGAGIFAEVSSGRTLSAIETANLIEACRIADRLEKLNALVTGDADVWMYVKESRSDDGPVEVIINDPMKEARMHAAALRSLLAPFEGESKEAPALGEVPSNVSSIKAGLSKPSRPAARKKRPA